MDNKRLLIAAVLSMAVLFGWQLIFPPPEAKRPAPPAAATAGSAAPAGESTAAPAPAGAPAGRNRARRRCRGHRRAGRAARRRSQPAPSRRCGSKTSSVAPSSPTAAACCARSGFARTARPASGSSWWRRARRRAYPFSLVGEDGAELALNGALFAVEQSGGAEGQRLTFRYRGPAGEAEKSFLLRADGRIEFEIRLPGDKRFAARSSVPGCASRTAEELANRFDLRKAVWSVGGEGRDARSRKGQGGRSRSPVAASTGSGSRTPISSRVVAPREPFGRAALRPVLLEPAGEAQAFDARACRPSRRSSRRSDKKLPRELLLDDRGPGGRARRHLVLGSEAVRPAGCRSALRPRAHGRARHVRHPGAAAPRRACSGSTPTWSPTTAGRSCS